MCKKEINVVKELSLNVAAEIICVTMPKYA